MTLLKEIPQRKEPTAHAHRVLRVGRDGRRSEAIQGLSWPARSTYRLTEEMRIREPVAALLGWCDRESGERLAPEVQIKDRRPFDGITSAQVSDGQSDQICLLIMS